MNTGIDVNHLRIDIIRPTLEAMGMYSRAAENLVLGTAIQESHLRYFHQLGAGPALGIYQIEPGTHVDIWQNYLKYRPEQAKLVASFASERSILGSRLNVHHYELIGNLFYATAICRLVYYRRPEALPDYDDIHGLSTYWKLFYNTIEGSGETEQFIENYQKYCLGD